MNEDVTPDETAMFVGIQHPGEAPVINDRLQPKRYSSWPNGAADGRPRSACIVITKNDGRGWEVEFSHASLDAGLGRWCLP